MIFWKFVLITKRLRNFGLKIFLIYLKNSTIESIGFWHLNNFGIKKVVKAINFFNSNSKGLFLLLVKEYPVSYRLNPKVIGVLDASLPYKLLFESLSLSVSLT